MTEIQEQIIISERIGLGAYVNIYRVCALINSTVIYSISC